MSTWDRIKNWVYGIGGSLVAVILGALAFVGYGKLKERKASKARLKETEQQAKTHAAEGRKKDHETLKKIASDPDPTSRDKRVDNWLREGVE